MIETPFECFTNYSSTRENGQSVSDQSKSYNYWNHNCLVRIVGDKPFSRGDRVRVYHVSTPSDSQFNMYVNVLSRYIEVSSKGAEGPQGLPEDYPTLLIASVRLPLDPEDNYTLNHTDNVEVIGECNSIVDGNLHKTVVLLVHSNYATVSSIDENGDRICEWIITRGE